jgi:predicted membrane protein
MDNNQNPIKHHNNGNIIAGLIIIAIGATYMLRNVGFPFPEWLFSWPSLLIIVGIYSGVKHNFRNNAWIFLIGLGLFFMGETYFANIPFMHNMPTREFLIPIMIISVGIIMILRPNRRFYGERISEKFANKDWSRKGNWQAYGSTSGQDSNDYININSVFSGVQRTILSKNFQGGKISCVFGGAEIDLTQADFTGTTILRLEAVFGGIKLIVPPHWQVINEIDGIFHGVDDKRRAPAGAFNDINKTLVLKGSAVFGGIEIRSY